MGLTDKHVNAYCGRMPKLVLARLYTDFSPEKPVKIYEEPDLTILVQAAQQNVFPSLLWNQAIR
jgi:hypothetical protein